MIPQNASTRALVVVAVAGSAWSAHAAPLERNATTKDAEQTVELPNSETRTVPVNPSTAWPWQDAISSPDVLRPEMDPLASIAEDNRAPPGAAPGPYRYALVTEFGEVVAISSSGWTFTRYSTLSQFRDAYYYEDHNIWAMDEAGGYLVKGPDKHFDANITGSFNADSRCDLTDNRTDFTSLPTGCDVTNPNLVQHVNAAVYCQGPCFYGKFTGQLADCGEITSVVGYYTMSYRWAAHVVESNCPVWNVSAQQRAAAAGVHFGIYGHYSRAGLSADSTFVAAVRYDGGPRWNTLPPWTADSIQWDPPNEIGFMHPQNVTRYTGLYQGARGNPPLPQVGFQTVPTAGVTFEILWIYTGVADDHAFLCVRNDQTTTHPIAGGYVSRLAAPESDFNRDVNAGWCTAAFAQYDNVGKAWLAPALGIAFQFKLEVDDADRVQFAGPVNTENKQLNWSALNSYAVTNGVPRSDTIEYLLNEIFIKPPEEGEGQ